MGAPQSIPRRLISVSDYHKMGDVGVLEDTGISHLVIVAHADEPTWNTLGCSHFKLPHDNNNN